MRKSIFLHLFFIINLLIALILTFRAHAHQSSNTFNDTQRVFVQREPRIPFKQAIKLFKKNIDAFIKKNKLQPRRRLFKHHCTAAHKQLIAHADKTKTVPFSLVTQLIHEHREQLMMAYPDVFLEKETVQKTRSPRPTKTWQQSTQPVHSRASRKRR